MRQLKSISVLVAMTLLMTSCFRNPIVGQWHCSYQDTYTGRVVDFDFKSNGTLECRKLTSETGFEETYTGQWKKVAKGVIYYQMESAPRGRSLTMSAKEAESTVDAASKKGWYEREQAYQKTRKTYSHTAVSSESGYMVVDGNTAYKCSYEHGEVMYVNENQPYRKIK